MMSIYIIWSEKLSNPWHKVHKMLRTVSDNDHYNCNQTVFDPIDHQSQKNDDAKSALEPFAVLRSTKYIFLCSKSIK